MLLKEVNTAFETHKIIKYAQNANTVIRRNIPMQRITDNALFGNLFKGANYNEYGTDYCDLYVVYENYGIGYIVQFHVDARNEVHDIVNQFKQSCFYSDTAFVAYMDAKTNVEKDWIRDAEIQLVSYFAPEKVAGYMELKKQMQEYREKESVRKAEEREREAAEFVEKMNRKAEEKISAAKDVIRNGGRLQNDSVTVYKDRYDSSTYSIINHLMRMYNIDVPLRTQGWINDKLANAKIENGKCETLQYRKVKGAQCSQRFFDCMNELITAVRAEVM